MYELLNADFIDKPHNIITDMIVNSYLGHVLCDDGL